MSTRTDIIRVIRQHRSAAESEAELVLRVWEAHADGAELSTVVDRLPLPDTIIRTFRRLRANGTIDGYLSIEEH